ncbi:MAG: UDP-3-O-(3-hydroxymyristoyl)glucosamine N-acyltransferase [Gemmatimonadaceae bacterium]|nr:UDP-3-O-(3-hydroxymyristoyl)glucosamine N-acyltransferase [Gemmatimonadaceae bacterium]
MSAAHPGGAAAGATGGLTAGDIAERVGGVLAGDPSVVVSAVAPIERAAAGELSFLAGTRYLAAAATTRAAVLLVAPDVSATPTPGVSARIVVDKPMEALLALLPLLYVPPVRQAGVHPSAVVGEGVSIGPEVAVGPYAILGHGAVLGAGVTVHAHAIVGPGVTVGAGSEIGPHVTLHSGTVVGQRVQVRSGARIGSEGFKYVFRDGQHRKLPHIGRCVLEDDVEVGANSCIDRGSINDTVIGAGTKIDNLVHVAHNVRIGKLCLLMAQVGIAGSTQVGDGVILAGQVGLVDNISIGDGAMVGAQSGVFGDIPAGGKWSGTHARPHRDHLRASAALHRLAAIIRPLEKLLEKGS